MAEECVIGRRDMIETNQCTIIPFQKTDDDEVKQLYRNHDVRRYLGGIRTEDDLQSIFDEMHSMNEEVNWVIRKKNTKEFVGLISLGLHHDGNFHEVSYQLLPIWWGKGYGTEVVYAVLDYAFLTLNLPKVGAETQAANIPSRRLLEKVGMREEGRVIRFGEEQVIYSITYK